MSTRILGPAHVLFEIKIRRHEGRRSFYGSIDTSGLAFRQPSRNRLVYFIGCKPATTAHRWCALAECGNWSNLLSATGGEYRQSSGTGQGEESELYVIETSRQASGATRSEAQLNRNGPAATGVNCEFMEDLS